MLGIIPWNFANLPSNFYLICKLNEYLFLMKRWIKNVIDFIWLLWFIYKQIYRIIKSIHYVPIMFDFFLSPIFSTTKRLSIGIWLVGTSSLWIVNSSKSPTLDFPEFSPIVNITERLKTRKSHYHGTHAISYNFFFLLISTLTIP